MTLYADLVNEILESCDQSVEPQVARVVRNTVVEFCEFTKALQVTLDPITIQPNIPLYVVIPPANRQIVEIMWGQINDRKPLYLWSEDQLDLYWKEQSAELANIRYLWNNFDSCSDTDWRQLTSDFPPIAYIDRSTNDYRLRLVGIPTTLIANGLTVKVSVKPSRNSTTVDDWLIEDNYLSLLDGVKSKMFAIPKKPWTDAQLALYHRNLFEEAKNKVRMKVMRSFVRDDEATGHVKAWV